MVTVIANQKRTTAVDGDAVPCSFNPTANNAGTWIENQPCVLAWLKIQLTRGFGGARPFTLGDLEIGHWPTGNEVLSPPASVGGSTTSSSGVIYEWSSSEAATIWMPVWVDQTVDGDNIRVNSVLGTFSSYADPRQLVVTAFAGVDTAPSIGFFNISESPGSTGDWQWSVYVQMDFATSGGTVDATFESF